jgi:hypothetical protein
MDKVNVEAWVKRNEDGTIEVRGVRASEDGALTVKPVGKQCIDDSIFVAQTLLSATVGSAEDESLYKFVSSNYALMAITTGVEQALKTLAEKYSPTFAKKVLKEDPTFFQKLHKANNFFKKPELNARLTACTNHWQSIKDAVSYSHRVRHSSGLLSTYKELGKNQKPKFIKDEVINLMSQVEEFINNLEEKLSSNSQI